MRQTAKRPAIVRLCRTMTQLSEAMTLMKSGKFEGVKIEFQCAKCYATPAIALRKIAVGDFIYCEYHAFAAARESDQALKSENFETYLVQCRGAGIYRFYLYSPPSAKARCPLRT
jgi:hypothetical protein